MVLTTRQKLRIARVASVGLRVLRRLAGRDASVKVARQGINWAFDLREGIDLALYLGRYQTVPKRLVDDLVKRGDRVVIDIGANVGAFTLPLAAAVGATGHVIAIEPTQFALNKLKTNLSLNPTLAAHVTAMQGLLGDGTSSSTDEDAIFSSWPVDGAAIDGVHPLHGGRPMSTEGAVRTSLDALLASNEALRKLAPQIALIKLDVDGHELSVLRGARQTIAAVRPALLIEIAPHVQDEREGGLAALIGELEHQGYKLSDPETGKPISHGLQDLKALIPHGAGLDLLGTLDG